MNDRHPIPERLDAYVLEELEDAARRDVAAHLDDCATCRETVAALQAALAAYRSVEPAPLAERTLDRLLLLQRAQGAPARAQRRRLFANVAVAAAVAGVIFVGGFRAGLAARDARSPAPELLGAPARTGAPAPSAEPRAPASFGTPLRVTFAVAHVDRLGSPAIQDTTWN
ncbi:MAG: zf-HC2 domain-containing protein [Candidatus Krumholzibacteria bacterium]|jgi:anti-sigma factor RsiW|nr:zf-HC2 domain-containing protein [Candidatus Krumholzibacteria bacterium]